MAIDKFSGPYRFLSNFWLAEVQFEGRTWPSVEHAYQAAKSLDPEYRDQVRFAARPGAAKALGRRVVMRADWEDVKLDIMERLVRDKFKDPALAQKLRDTGNVELIEGNTWNDTFWGVCRGAGRNELGKILMKVRAELS